VEKDEIYNKLLDGGFSKIEKSDAGYHVEKNYNSMIVYAELNPTGKIVKIDTKATLLAWGLGVIFFPLGSIAVFLYMGSKRQQRANEMRLLIEKILR